FLVTPAHQFPTGALLSPERRRALLAWAADGGRYVLEDDYDSEYAYDSPPIRTLQRLAPGRAVYFGAASPTPAPAPRVGSGGAPRGGGGAAGGPGAAPAGFPPPARHRGGRPPPAPPAPRIPRPPRPPRVPARREAAAVPSRGRVRRPAPAAAFARGGRRRRR